MCLHTPTRTNFTTRSTCVCVGRVRSPPAVLDARAPCTLSPHPADVAAMPKKAHAKQQMPMCTYGLACTRKGCVYRHPPRTAAAAQKPSAESVEPCKPFIAGICQFGSRCHNYHPPEDEVLRLRVCKWLQGQVPFEHRCSTLRSRFCRPRQRSSPQSYLRQVNGLATNQRAAATMAAAAAWPWRQETTCDVSDMPFEPRA